MIKNLKKLVYTGLVAYSTSSLAITPPAAPKIDGVAQGESNWIKILLAISESSMHAAGLIFSAALACIMLAGILVALWKEFVSKEGGTGKILIGSIAIGAVGGTLGYFLVNDLMTQLGQSS